MRVTDRKIHGPAKANDPRTTARGRALRFAAVLGALAAFAAGPARAQGGQTFAPATLPTASLNANFKQHYGPLYTLYPTLGTTGDVTLGGVLFNIPVVPGTLPLFNPTRYLPTRAESNFWLSAYSWNMSDEQVPSVGLTEMDLGATNFNQVPDVYALMGTWWGQRTHNRLLSGTVDSRTSVEMTFEDPLGGPNVIYTKNLTAGPPNYNMYTPFGGPLAPPSNADIRDFHHSGLQGRYSNVINGTTTQQVFTDTYFGLSDKNSQRTYRLDRVRISVPAPYNQWKLIGMKVKDNGSFGNHRVFVGAITAHSGHCANINLLQTYESGNTYLQVYRVTNCSTYSWTNPVSLVLRNLTAGVTLTNATNTTTVNDVGSPYINATISSPLLPGQSVIMTLRFTTTGADLLPAGQPGVSPFTGKILFGPGTR